MGKATVSDGILSAAQINPSHGQEFDVVIVQPDGSTIERHHQANMTMTSSDDWQEITALFDEYGDKEGLFNLAPSANESKEKYDKITRISIKDGYLVFEPKGSNHYILNNHAKNIVELNTLQSAQKIQKEINVLRENVHDQEAFERMLPVTLNVIEKHRQSIAPAYGADYTIDDIKSTLRQDLEAALNVEDIENALSVEMSKLSWVAQSTSIVKQLRSDATVSKYGAIGASMQKPRETHTDNFIRFDIPFVAQEIQQVMATKGISHEEAVEQFNNLVREWASEFHPEPGVTAKRSYMISDLQVNANDPHVHVQVACQSVCVDELTGIPIIFSAGQKEVRNDFDKVLVPRLKAELGITMVSMYGERTLDKQPAPAAPAQTQLQAAIDQTAKALAEPRIEGLAPEMAYAPTVTQLAKGLGIDKTGLNVSDTLHVIRSMPLGDVQLGLNKAAKVLSKDEEEALAEQAKIELRLQSIREKKSEIAESAIAIQEISKVLALGESLEVKEKELLAIEPLYQKANEQISAIVAHPAFADLNKDDILDSFAETVINAKESNDKIERAVATVEKFDWINVDGLQPADVMLAVAEEAEALVGEAKDRETRIKETLLHEIEDKENAQHIEDPTELLDVFVDQVNDNFNEVEARAIEAEKAKAEFEKQLAELTASYEARFKEMAMAHAATTVQAERLVKDNAELVAKNTELTNVASVAEHRAQSFETLYHNQKSAFIAAVVERMPDDEQKMLVQASMASNPVAGVNEAFDAVQSRIAVLENEKRASANAIAKLGDKLNEKFGVNVELAQNTAVSLNRIADSVDSVENNEQKHKEHMKNVLNAFHKQFGSSVSKEQLVDMFNQPEKYLEQKKGEAASRFREGVEQAQAKKQHSQSPKENKNDDPDKGPKM